MVNGNVAEMLSPLSQKRHSSPPMTSRMTVQNLLQIIQQNVQQVVGTHKLPTTLLQTHGYLKQPLSL